MRRTDRGPCLGFGCGFFSLGRAGPAAALLFGHVWVTPANLGVLGKADLGVLFVRQRKGKLKQKYVA